jgi:hypothetical protein
MYGLLHASVYYMIFDKSMRGGKQYQLQYILFE